MSDKKKKKRGIMSQLVVSSRVVRTALSARLAEQELYPGQDAVLLAIGKEDGIAMRDLAIRLSVRPPTITKTITRLTAQSLLEKRISESDGRQSFVFLTEKGQALVSQVRQAQKTTEHQALRGLSAKDRKTLRKLLLKIERNFAIDDTAPDTTPSDIVA